MCQIARRITSRSSSRRSTSRNLYMEPRQETSSHCCRRARLSIYKVVTNVMEGVFFQVENVPTDSQEALFPPKAHGSRVGRLQKRFGAMALFREAAGHMIQASTECTWLKHWNQLSHPESGVRKVVTGEKVLATSSLSDRMSPTIVNLSVMWAQTGTGRASIEKWLTDSQAKLNVVRHFEPLEFHCLLTGFLWMEPRTLCC